MGFNNINLSLIFIVSLYVFNQVSSAAIPLNLDYTNNRTLVSLEANLYNSLGQLESQYEATVVTTLQQTILFKSLIPVTKFECDPINTQKGKFGQYLMCGKIVSKIIEFPKIINGTRKSFKLDLTQYAFIHTPNSKDHSYIFSTDFDPKDFSQLTGTGWDYDPGTPYHYYEVDLRGIFIQGYQTYTPYQDNKIIFDSGMGTMEFFSSRYNDFFVNFVQTYCDDYTLVSGNYRCSCEGKNFQNLPDVLYAFENTQYQMVPDSYTFDAYIQKSTYRTWCQLGIKQNQFQSSQLTHFNIAGLLFFRLYNISFRYHEDDTSLIKIGLNGGSTYNPLQSIISSSIVYAIVVVLLIILVICLALMRHRRLRFEEAIKKQNPDRYNEIMFKIDNQETNKHYQRLEANAGVHSHSVNSQVYKNAIMNMEVCEIDPNKYTKPKATVKILNPAKRNSLKNQVELKDQSQFKSAFDDDDDDDK